MKKVIIKMLEGTLKHVEKDYICYNRNWLLAHLDQEYELLKNYRDSNFNEELKKKEFKRIIEEMKQKGVIE